MTTPTIEYSEVDYYDSGEILLKLLTPSQECPSATICDWDVDFDCHITDDDYDAALEFIGECTFDPCTCEGESGFASTPGGGHSLERFMEAIASIEAQLTEEQLAFAWERFLMIYNGY